MVLPAPSPDPLILTLKLDDDSFDFFNRMRRAHFPEQLNKVPAHVTLFHHLPGTELAAIEDVLADRAALAAPMEIKVTRIRFLGQGVAYDLASAALQELRADLAATFTEWLVPQDRQLFRPHVTIQNKVAAHKARRLAETLAATFEPFAVNGIGLSLWHYRGGPWEAAGEFLF